jgi:hypothetical protein
MWFEWVESNACFGLLAVFVFGDLRQSLLRSLRFSSLTPPDLRHKVLGFRRSGTPISGVGIKHGAETGQAEAETTHPGRSEMRENERPTTENLVHQSKGRRKAYGVSSTAKLNFCTVRRSTSWVTSLALQMAGRVVEEVDRSKNVRCLERGLLRWALRCRARSAKRRHRLRGFVLRRSHRSQFTQVRAPGEGRFASRSGPVTFDCGDGPGESRSRSSSRLLPPRGSRMSVPSSPSRQGTTASRCARQRVSRAATVDPAGWIGAAHFDVTSQQPADFRLGFTPSPSPGLSLPAGSCPGR